MFEDAKAWLLRLMCQDPPSAFADGKALPIQHLDSWSSADLCVILRYMDWKGIYTLSQKRPYINRDLDNSCSTCKKNTPYLLLVAQSYPLDTLWACISRWKESASLMMASSPDRESHKPQSPHQVWLDRLYQLICNNIGKGHTLLAYCKSPGVTRRRVATSHLGLWWHGKIDLECLPLPVVAPGLWKSHNRDAYCS